MFLSRLFLIHPTSAASYWYIIDIIDWQKDSAVGSPRNMRVPCPQWIAKWKQNLINDCYYDSKETIPLHPSALRKHAQPEEQKHRHGNLSRWAPGPSCPVKKWRTRLLTSCLLLNLQGASRLSATHDWTIKVQLHAPVSRGPARGDPAGEAVSGLTPANDFRSCNTSMGATSLCINSHNCTPPRPHSLANSQHLLQNSGVSN